jgi:Lipocalin-like domain
MKGTGRGVAGSGLLGLLVASIAAASFAQAPARPLREQLVGHWQLVSVTVNSTPPYGANPEGSMFLDEGGHYSVIVITDGSARSVAYFGTYTVDDADSSLTMHVESSNFANAAGRDEKRFVAFSGDELILTNQRSGGPIGPVKLTWKRAN